jgi:hypothetical protein
MPTISLDALFQGLLGASSLLIGALVGIFWQPGRVFSAAIMAFGSGTLLSAIAFDIAEPVYETSGFWPVLTGFMLGGTLFTVVINYGTWRLHSPPLLLPAVSLPPPPGRNLRNPRSHHPCGDAA